MNRLLAGIGIVAMIFAPLGVVMACSRHGTNAGNELDDWIETNMHGSGLGQMGANGNQVVNVGGHGKAGWAAHDVYFVDITLPDGSKLTENGSSTWGGHSASRFADDPGTRGGSKMEAWLANRGKEMIRDWFEDYQPEDVHLNDFAG